MAALVWTLGFGILFCLLHGQVSCEYKMVCYFSNWAQYRSDPYMFTVDNVDPKLCTHLILAFAQLNSSTMGLNSIEYNDELTYNKLVRIKILNPDLKTLVAVGGYGAKSVPFTEMTSHPEYRQLFINQSIEFVKKFGFDGLDLDWEYPTHQTVSDGETILEEKEYYAELLKEMGPKFRDAGLILSAAVSAGTWLVDQAYDVPVLNRYLDFVSLMAYDFNGPWNKVTGHPSALRSHDTLNVQSAAEHWISKGLGKSKLVIGLSTYARTFKLADSKNTSVGAPVDGAGAHGRFTGEQGIMAYYEVCTLLADPNSAYRKQWLDHGNVPYIEDGDNWIGYEDETSIIIKVEWIKKLGYGGAMLWSLDMDDFTGRCSTSIGPYPLVSLVHNAFQASPGSPGEPCLSLRDNGDHYCLDPNAVCVMSTLTCECVQRYKEHRKTCKKGEVI